MLSDRIIELPDEITLLETARGSFSAKIFQDLLPLGTDNQNLKTVCINTTMVEFAIGALVLLDGYVSNILLLPTMMDVKIRNQLIAQADCDLIVTEKSAAEFIVDVPVVDDLEKLALEVSTQNKIPTDTRWLLATSGTTGSPKVVAHTLASLSRTTKVSNRARAVPCWGLVFDFSRFAGLQVLLQSILSGSKLIVPDSNNELDKQLHFLKENNCTHLSATPTLWRKIVMSTVGTTLDLEQITLGGEIADQRILKAVKQTFRNARVAHIFASTEAGVGFSVSDGKSGFPKNYLYKPPLGIELRIIDNQLFVKNQLVDRNYVGINKTLADSNGWIATGDVVEINGDRIYFKGRANGSINVGGDKVLPEEVERVLLGYPTVNGAFVCGKKNPITGAVIIAEVTLEKTPKDKEEIRKELLKLCIDHLERHKVPAVIRIVDELKTSEVGKLARIVQ